MKTSLLLLLVLLFLCACNGRKPVVSHFRTKSFVLVDTNYVPGDYLPGPKDIEFPIYYIGAVKDTICIGRQYWRGRTPVSRWPRRFACSRIYTNENLKIEVDSARDFRSYVLTIRNISDSIIFMGRTFSVYFLHRQFRDREGHWVDIGRSLSEMGICGTFQPTIYLRPGEIILSKLAVGKGSRANDCRLVFGYGNNCVYSSVFKMYVDDQLAYFLR